MANAATTRLPTIGAVIRAWRKFREMTSTELSEKAGVRIAYLSEVEHDRTIHPQEEFLEKLADALEVPLEDILGRRMPPKDGGAVSILSSKQGVVGQGRQQVSADENGDGEAAEKAQASKVATYSGLNPALGLYDSLLDSTFEQIEDIIESKHFSEEQMKRWTAGLIDAAKLLVKAIKPETEK
jgi:transcriptional regulator with XRE-family HTH domain